MSNVSIEVTSNIDVSVVVQEVHHREKDIVKLIKKAVTRACPVDTGYMKSTIDSVLDEDGGAVYVGADYAPYTEFKEGTSCTGWFSNAVNSCMSEVKKLWH